MKWDALIHSYLDQLLSGRAKDVEKIHEEIKRLRELQQQESEAA